MEEAVGLTLTAMAMIGSRGRMVPPRAPWRSTHTGSATVVSRHSYSLVDSRLAWTNEEGDAGQTVTTVTFEETAGKTRLVVHNLYPSAEAVDTGSTGAMPEVLDQLDELLASLGSRTETK